MKYLSLCSGIEAATQAWHPLGWEPVAFSEIEAFPSAVLAHHYPTVPNLGDMTNYENWNIGTIDLLVGGTPCQSFSVAGLRKGLDDPRGNLMLTFGAIAKRFQPRWLVWENVPGVLSSNGGKDFGTFLGMLAELGYGFAYRVLDAQYVRTCRYAGAVPQRRRRVFVVGYFGDWRRAAAVLFDRESVSGNPPPSRKAGEGAAGDAGEGVKGSHVFLDRAAFNQGVNAQYDPEIKENAETSGSLVARGPHAVAVPSVANALQTTCNDYSRADGFNAIAIQTANTKANGRNWSKDVAHTLDRASPPAVAIQGSMVGRDDKNGPQGSGVDLSGACFTLNATDKHAVCFGGDVARTLSARHDSSPCADRGMGVVAFGVNEKPDVAHCLRSGASKADKHESTTYIASSAVRRLTPIECERLQGFPDNFTRIPWRGKDAADCPDGPRYKALGNSMAVNVMEWIGHRINLTSTKGATWNAKT